VVVPPQRARVFVTGDEPLLSLGLASILGRTPGIESVYVDTTAGARRLMEDVGTDALVWAGDYLDGPTLEALRELRRTRPATSLCLLAQRADAHALERLIAQSGERFAFVLRAARLDAGEFVELVHSVLRGQSTVDAALLRRLTSDDAGPDGLQLTHSDREVMELVAAGLRNAEIARRLWKSEKTIEKHVGRLFSKLGLSPKSAGHLDRRVTATRIYLASQGCRQRGLIEHDAFEIPSSGVS
jgi:DNA-binding NarL/FixJ family response regulator